MYLSKTTFLLQQSVQTASCVLCSIFCIICVCGYSGTSAYAQTVSFDMRDQNDYDAFAPFEEDVTLSYDATDGLIVNRNSGVDSAFLPYAHQDLIATAQLRFFADTSTTDYATLFLRDPIADDGVDEGYGFTISNAGELLLLRLDALSNQTQLGRISNSGLDPVARDVNMEARAIGSTLEFTAWEFGTEKPAPQIAVSDVAPDPHLEGAWIALSNSAFDAPPGNRIAFRTLELTTVPEPSSALLSVCSAVAVLGTRRRRD